MDSFGALYVYGYELTNPESAEPGILALGEASAVLVKVLQDGRIDWIYRFSAGFNATRDRQAEVMIAPSGTVHAQIPGHHVILSQDGEQLSDEERQMQLNAIDRDGVMVGVYQDYYTYAMALDQDGRLLWQTVLDNGEYPRIIETALGAGDRVYAALRSIDHDSGDATTGIAALDVDSGDIQWTAEVPGDPAQSYWASAAALDEEGNIYQYWRSEGAAGAFIVADAAGNLLDQVADETGFAAGGTGRLPVIGTHGLVFVGQDFYCQDAPVLGQEHAEPVSLPEIGWNNSNYVVLADPDLILVMTRDMTDDSIPGNGGGVETPPRDHRVPAGLVALDYEGKNRWRYSRADLNRDVAVIPGDGVIYAVTMDGRFIAIEAPVSGVDTGPWPMPYGGANRNRRLSE
jgi:outer membrane protein assembly factor BamB